MPTWLPQMSVSRSTGAATVSMTVTPTTDVNIDAVRFNIGTAGATAGNFTVTLSSGTSAVYNTLLFSQNMSATTDINQTLLGPVAKGDALVCAYTNTNARTWGCEVYMSRVEGVE